MLANTHCGILSGSTLFAYDPSKKWLKSIVGLSRTSVPKFSIAGNMRNKKT